MNDEYGYYVPHMTPEERETRFFGLPRWAQDELRRLNRVILGEENE